MHLSFLILTLFSIAVFSLRLGVYPIIFVGGLRKYGIPVTDLLLFLVFANKQDLPGALSMEEIREVNTYQSCGSALVSMRIRIQLFYFNADTVLGSQTNLYPDPYPSQTLQSLTV